MTTTASGPAAARFAASNAVAEQFFHGHADAIARTCHAMAERFQRNGRLFVCGHGAQRSDVAHVVVEFMHPVVVGKRALPAMALSDGDAGLRMLDTMARGEDLLLLICAAAPSAAQDEVLTSAKARQLLTIALVGSPVSSMGASAEHVFVVPSADPCVVQETHEMLYHVLWELVHVFFDHRAVQA